ncbi:MAG: hypothetical protein DWH91_04980 [Planctomycetota bacterium]|nr:MAG: hypothetical protein DWH91_04980 [Planctomycetota bacterium]
MVVGEFATSWWFEFLFRELADGGRNIHKIVIFSHGISVLLRFGILCRAMRRQRITFRRVVLSIPVVLHQVQLILSSQGSPCLLSSRRQLARSTPRLDGFAVAASTSTSL